MKFSNKKIILTLIVLMLIILAFNTENIKFVNDNRASEKNNDVSKSGEENSKSKAASLGLSRKVSRKLCEDLYGNNQTPEELLTAKKYSLNAFFRKLDGMGEDGGSLNVIGNVAGLSFDDVNKAVSGLNHSEFLSTLSKRLILPDDYKSRPELSGEDRRYLEKVFASKNDKDLIFAIQQGKIDPASMQFGSPLLELAIKANPQIPREQLRSLIEAGLQVDLQTIATAIDLNLPIEQIEVLTEAYSKPLSEVWIEDDQPMNLALLSAKKLNPGLFHYFNNQKQIDPYAQNFAGLITLLDVIPAPINDSEKDLAVRFVKSGLAFGLKPVNYSTTKRLNAFLPDDLKRQYSDQLKSWVQPTEEQLKHAADLQQQLNEFDQQILAAKELQQKCLADHQYSLETYVDDLVRSKSKSENLSLATKKRIVGFLDETEQSFYQNPQKFATQLKEKGVTLNIKKPSSDLVALRTKLTDLIMDEQWDEALLLSQQFPDKEGVNTVLSSYLWKEYASWEKIEVLINQGAELQPFMVRSLAYHGKTELIEKLIPYGLDVTYQDSQGRNALSISVENVKNADIVKLLIDMGTPLKPKGIGMDPLDLAFEQLDMFNPAIPDARFNNILLLLQAGAPIERSHREKVSMLRSTNPDAYTALMQYIPDLESYFK
jgi:hypothetical protein